MKVRLKRYKKRDKPEHGEYNKLVTLVEQLANFTVDGSTGLNLEWTSAGFKLSLTQRPQPRYAEVTEEISAYNPTTKELGMGKAFIDYDDAGVLTDMGLPEVWVANDIEGVIPVGKRIKIIHMGTPYAVFTAGCSTNG